jgi:hypothetical protein
MGKIAMPTNDEIISAMDRDRAMQIWEQTKEKYPIMKSAPVDFVYNPTGVERPGNAGIETYPVGETYRPPNVPLNRVGIGVWSSQGVNPQDIVGDYLSHHLIYNDPKFSELYKQFQTSTTPEGQAFLQELYREATQNRASKEQRPYDEWLQVSGWPQYLRGYVSQQFNPDELSKIYSPEQIKAMDEMKKLLGLSK